MRAIGLGPAHSNLPTREISAETPQLKAFICDAVKADAGEDRVCTFTITTDGIDRDKDTIATTGWKLADYQKNPVVLWAHDYRQPPVARTRSLTQTEKGLSAVAEFPAKGVSAFADTVYELVKGGFLNACSVGFRADKWTYNEERGGVDFLEQQLLEWSICPVPANPQALIEARAVGIDTTLVKDWAEQVLKAETPAAPVVEPVAADIATQFLAFHARLDHVAKSFDALALTVSKSTDPVVADEPITFDLADDIAEDRLFLALDDDPGEATVDGDMFKTAFADTLGAALKDLMPALVRSEIEIALKRARGQAV